MEEIEIHNGIDSSTGSIDNPHENSEAKDSNSSINDNRDWQLSGSTDSTASCSFSSLDQQLPVAPPIVDSASTGIQCQEDSENREAMGLGNSEMNRGQEHPEPPVSAQLLGKPDTLAVASYPQHNGTGTSFAVGLPVGQRKSPPHPHVQADERSADYQSQEDAEDRRSYLATEAVARWLHGAAAVKGGKQGHEHHQHLGAEGLSLAASYEATRNGIRLREGSAGSPKQDKNRSFLDPTPKNTTPKNATPRPTVRRRIRRAASQPLMKSGPTLANNHNATRNRGRDELSTTYHHGTSNWSPVRPTRTLRRQASMNERVSKLRNSVSTRPVRLKKANRSKSDIPSTMNKRSGDLLGSSSSSSDQGTSDESSQDDNYDNNNKMQSPHNNKKTNKNNPRQMPKKTRSLNDAQSKQRLLGSDNNSNHTNNNNDTRPSLPAGRQSSGRDEIEDEDEDDVLLLIAKARAKLAMEGNDRAEAEAVLAQMSQDREQQHDKVAACSGASINSAGAASGGTASLPGAYEKVPGGGFERKETFSHASITRHSVSAQMRQQPTTTPQQPFHASYNHSSYNGSDLGSISSADSDDMSDIMEIEFSQQSMSNHDSDDDKDEDDKKPAAKNKDDTDNNGSFSLGNSLATVSLNPDEVFAAQQQKKPAAKKQPKDVPLRSRSAMSATSLSKGGGSSSAAMDYQASFASMPAAFAPPLNEDDSDVSSARRRRTRTRRRHGRRNSAGAGRDSAASYNNKDDCRRRRNHHDDAGGKQSSSDKMKDGSTENQAGQLVIAAEVVRSEEEMVHELRQKVKKEILESMAKELNEMEASVSAFSVDLSMADASMQATPSEQGTTGSQGGRMSRMPAFNTGQQSQGKLHQTSDHRRGHHVPPSPMSASLPVNSFVRGRRSSWRSAEFTPRQQPVTPNQSRRLRSLNLSGSSPRFLRTRRSPKRSLSMKMPTFRAKKSTGSLPQLRTSYSAGSYDNNDDASSSSSDEEGTSRQKLDIVDAVNVIPAPPPTSPRRSKSQPSLPTMRAAAQARQKQAAATHHQLQAQPRPGSLLDQLRTTMTTTAVPASEATAIATNLNRQESGESNISSSLPELTTPPPSEGRSQGSLLLNNSSQSQNDPTVSQQESTFQQQGSPAQASSNAAGHASEQSFAFGSDGVGGGCGSSSLLLRDVQEPDNESEEFRDEYHPAATEYHVVNNHDLQRQRVSDMPSDWDLQQLELAELGLRHASRGSTSLGILSSSSYRTRLNDDEQDQQQESSLIVTHENELPSAWITPVGLLVAGAVILAIVLFAA
ncbi:expressed unknown protein [Seminavis robusta]|uniref:Uncharacterized protein n=1 Tax=Seminavis robusta TaxID=568900 RepID=A0A9N8HIP6_9STRA|nr:expressed unknown protein [Seminavis robusta]|eukprot:Sro608_g174790.1 n/a (1285) ;mRNA; f:17611-21465